MTGIKINQPPSLFNFDSLAHEYEGWYERIHEWAYTHFPDKKHGTWLKYLHRDGTVSTTVKGNSWGGPFHIPRMQLYCWKLLEEMKAGATAD